MMASREVPWSSEAESALLGAAMLTDAALEVLVRDTSSIDFYQPAHQIIAETLRDLWHAGIVHPDPTIVADEIKAAGQLDDIGGSQYLSQLQASCPATTSAPRYARIVTEYSLRRQVIHVANEVSSSAYQLEDVHDLVQGFKARMADVALPVDDTGTSDDILAFLETESKYDWLVPGLLERRDRLILTGGEGAGKSTLLRQMAVSLAAGVHPFSAIPVAPVRVYYLDVENSANQVRRKMSPLVDMTMKRLHPENLRIDCRTGGLELTRRHDRSWLMGRLAANRPDVLITGPIYKLHADDPSDEKSARALASIFDEMRDRFGVTLILETHSPHGSPGSKRPLRPIGSSLWLRWPEFGFGLRRDPRAETVVKWETWRGPRDERHFPEALRRGMADEFPWVETHLNEDPGPADPEPDEEPF